MAELEHLAANVAAWQARGDSELDLARRMWGVDDLTWGVFQARESEAHLLPEDVRGLRVAEIGCGTGYVSAWLARRGALPVGIDPTPGQLAIVRRMQDETGIRFPLVRAAGEQVPFAPGTFDLVVSEYGAAIWADPDRWIPEAARLLRAGGELVFLGNSTLSMLCAPDDESEPIGLELQRAQHGMKRFLWTGDPTVEFHLSPGDWIRLLRRTGFEVLDLVELYARADDDRQQNQITAQWARQWPVEEVWKARKAR